MTDGGLNGNKGVVTDALKKDFEKGAGYRLTVDGTVLFYEPNMDSRYDDLVVVDGNMDARFLLHKHYGVSGADGIYRIVRRGNAVSLIPVRVE